MWAPVAARVADASKVGPGPSSGTGNSNFSGTPSVLEGVVAVEVEVVAIVLDGDALVTGMAVCVASSGAFVGSTGGTDCEASPMIQDCSGVKLGGAQAVLLTKPSLLRVMHELPAPTPLLTAPWTRVRPVVVVPVRLKKNC